MTHSFIVHQNFAVANGLTIVQTTTLAAFMTLPLWTKTVTVEGVVWYMYSEEKMSKDFPLLFSNPKRVYKNIRELAKRGFVELSSFGKTKYVRFTEKCATWGRSEDEGPVAGSPEGPVAGSPEGPVAGSPEGPVAGSPEGPVAGSPEGPVAGRQGSIEYGNKPKEESSESSKYKEFDPFEFFSEEKRKGEVLQPATMPGQCAVRSDGLRNLRSTSEGRSCLFANSKFAKFEDFEKCFTSPEFEKIDIYHYYNVVADWSASKGSKRTDWIAQARNIMRSDEKKGELHLKPQYQPMGSLGISREDALYYLSL